MTRNIDTRVEVGFPIYDENLKSEIKDIINVQLADNTKSREINSHNTNKYHKTHSAGQHRAQVEIYDYLKNKTKQN
jgi:polyphosphate kinase